VETTERDDVDHVALAISVAKHCYRLALPELDVPTGVQRIQEETVNGTSSVVIALSSTPGRNVRMRCVADTRYGWQRGKCHVTVKGTTRSYLFRVNDGSVSVVASEVGAKRKMLVFTLDLLIQQLGQTKDGIAHQLRTMGYAGTIKGLEHCIRELSALTDVSIEMTDDMPFLSGTVNDMEPLRLRLTGAAATFVQCHQPR